MKRVLIGGLSVVAMIVGVSAANAQANINPNEYPRNAGERYGASGNVPYEWYGAPGPNKRGNMCVVHVDPLRGYGYQKACPPPAKAAAPAVRHKKKKVASR